MTLFAQQPIKIVADHELDSWDFSIKDLTATVQFKSMQLSFLHTDLQACKEFAAKLQGARAIFGTARIPADNLINSLIDAGYKLVKTEVNRPSQTTLPRDHWSSGGVTLLSNSDQRLMSDMYNTPYRAGEAADLKYVTGGMVNSSGSYTFGEASNPVFLPVDEASAAPSDSGVSREGNTSIHTVYLSTPLGKGDAFANAVMEAFAQIDLDKARGR